MTEEIWAWLAAIVFLAAIIAASVALAAAVGA